MTVQWRPIHSYHRLPQPSQVSFFLKKAKARYGVKLDDDKEVSLKPECIEEEPEAVCLSFRRGLRARIAAKFSYSLRRYTQKMQQHRDASSVGLPVGSLPMGIRHSC